MDTIFALATARARAGVAVIRVSGPRAFDVALSLCGTLPDHRVAAVRALVWAGEVIDEAIVIRFDEGRSFTGERVVEFQVHGGLAVIDALIRALASQEGLRMAGPGEFTRRALENGRLDLAQVEGLADLIDSETEAQRRQAQRVFSGALGRRVEGWRQTMIRAKALIEATIDFADEDVPVDVYPEVTALLDGLLSDLKGELAGSVVAERLRDGFEVAIVGAPNAGKSTLLNRLAGRDAALVSDRPGTTRDVIEVRMDLAGLPVTFLDTAGIRETDDIVEEMGIARAIARAKAADLRVFLVVPGDDPDDIQPQADDLVVRGRCDENVGRGPGVSGLTGEGVDALMREVQSILGRRVHGAGVLVRQRHREAIQSAVFLLEVVMSRLSSGGVMPEILSAEIGDAILATEALVGRIDVEDLLGEIFASFCIGK